MSHSYLISALLVVGAGGGVLLFERFTESSRRFCLLTLILAGWLVPLGWTHAADAASVHGWLRVAFIGIPLTVPAIYYMAASISPRVRRPTPAVIWGLSGAWSLLNAVSPVLVDGLQALCLEGTIRDGGWLAALYLVYEGGVIAITLRQLVLSRRAALSGAESREKVVLAGAAAIGSLSMLDYFVAADPFRAGPITPIALTVGVFMITGAAIRYRFFAPGQSFATDEVLTAMADAVLVCDRDGLIRGSNAACHALLGRSEGWLHGRSVDRVLGPRGGSADTGWTPRPGEARTASLEARAREGDPIPVTVTVQPLRHGRGHAGSVLVARDERDRLRAERARQEAELRYRSLYHHHPALVHEFDTRGNLVALNPANRRLLGLSLDEPVSERHWSEFVHPDDVDDTGQSFERVMQGASAEYETRLLSPDLGERVARGVVVPVRDGDRVVGVFGVGLDVTDEVETKRALEVQRRYFASLFDGSPEAIVLVATDDRVIRVNEEFTRMFGYSPEEATGRELSGLIVPEALEGEGLELNERVRTGGVIQTETVRRHRDGSTIDVSLLARRLSIPGGPDQLYSVYRDITERKNTERLLREREAELRHAQRLEAVGKLAGGIAHDFNNLLTVINGHARFALDSAEADCAFVETLREIEKAGERAAALTQQLLAYSRRQVLHPQILSPNEVIRELEGMLGRLIGEHIRVETRLTPLEIRVRADRGQLEQVLVNLAVNARDAMPEGGTLSVETDLVEIPRRDPRIARWEIEPGRFVRIRVADTGDGMDDETVQHAFEPFYTTKEQGKGTGLGLATVFGIVKQSKGHVTLSSRPGDGTVCDVFVPLAAAEESTGRPVEAGRPEARREGGATGTVLVVEDEGAVRGLAVKILERQGLRVLSAENGVRALEVLDGHEHDVDLVLTDLVMPDMGGRELAERLRRRCPAVPVVFMSGYDETLIDDLDDHAAFIAKPFTPADLVRQIDATLAGAAGV